MDNAAGPQWLTTVGTVCVVVVAVVTFIKIIGNDDFDEGLRRLLQVVFAVGAVVAVVGGCWWIYRVAQSDDPTITAPDTTTQAVVAGSAPTSSDLSTATSPPTMLAAASPAVSETDAVEFVGAFLRAADDRDPARVVLAWEMMLTDPGRSTWAADETAFAQFWRDVVDNVNPRSLMGRALADGTVEVTGVLEYAVLPGAHECYPGESVEDVRFVVLRGLGGELRIESYAHNNERCEPG